MSKRILIIDDEENIRRVTRLTLQAAGYDVGEAADGERGLEAFGDGSTGMRCCWTRECPEWTDLKHSGISKIASLRRGSSCRLHTLRLSSRWMR